MKKFLFLSAIAILFAACQSKTEYTIKGSVADPIYEGQKVTLVERTDDEMVTVDSTIIMNGKFEIKGETERPVMRFLTLGENENSTRSILMVEPGTINVEYDSTFHISGSALNDVYSDFNSNQIELNKKTKAISAQYGAAMNDGTMTDELKEELSSSFQKISDESKTLHYDFVKNNIDNELGQFIFMSSSSMFDAEQQKEILAMSSDEYKAKKDVKRISDELAAIEEVAIGQPYKDFTMLNPKGEEVSLSDYVGKGKYVFVDFWAAWCGPCRQEMPNVVNAYEKYKNKGLEIVGVSLDKEEADWLKGIKDLNMTWPQMSDLKYWDSAARELYVIKGIPHTVLLDKEGIIIAKDLRGEMLDEKLAELLN